MFGKKEERSDLEIFTIFDSKAQLYEQPIFASNKNVLMRDFMNFLADPAQKSSRINLNAEDYAFFKIGSFDKGTGKITACNLEHVVNMHDLRAMVPQPVQASPQMGIVAT